MKSEIVFPVGTAEYEDVCVTFKLISNADSILFVPQTFYHYRMSTASVTHSLHAEKLIQNRLFVTENNLDYSKTHSVNEYSKILAERMLMTAKQNYLDNLQVLIRKNGGTFTLKLITGNYYRFIHCITEFCLFLRFKT